MFVAGPVVDNAPYGFTFGKGVGLYDLIMVALALWQL